MCNRYSKISVNVVTFSFMILKCDGGGTLNEVEERRAAPVLSDFS